MMDLPHRHVWWVVVVLLFLEYLCCFVSGTAWEHISLRYGTWLSPPKTPQEAERQGYRPVNKICKMPAYYGFLYIRGGNNKARFIYDSNGNLAGIQTAIPGNMQGFNSRNETIKVPAREVIPPILLSDDRDSFGIQMYTITAYFKHPRLICSPYAKNAHPGKGLYIQMGYNVEEDFMRIPMEARHLDPQWKKGSCRPQMGVHYFRSLSPDLPCEMLYPVFLMYNQDGLLGAFGWLFQGSPAYYAYEDELSWFKLQPAIYPYTFDENMLPSCMFNPDFRVFGLRIYLRNKESMICPIRTPVPAPRTTAPPAPTPLRPNNRTPYPYPHRPRRPHTSPPGTYKTLKPPSYDETVILDEDIREQESGASALLQRGASGWWRGAAGVALTLVGLHVLLQRWLLAEAEGEVLGNGVVRLCSWLVPEDFRVSPCVFLRKDIGADCSEIQWSGNRPFGPPALFQMIALRTEGKCRV
ncbi:uncharacterized protein LOC143301051 [Babylonia areolata]|uniref:uncharacterized protein LOC143301051 n=1 Tax=Babylonia areolata TaxID=304850 RepID=UPI003FD3B22D